MRPGTVFTLRLPPLLEPEPRAAPAEAPAPAAGRHTVLYVEDNPSNLRLVEWILATRGDVEVVGAGQAERGLELARTLAPALILLDVPFPTARATRSSPSSRRTPPRPASRS